LHDIVLKIPILFSFFLLIDFSGIAQSPWKSFWQLEGPEKCWVLFHPFIAGKARKFTIIADSTSKQFKNDRVLDGDDAGGQIDAFRHAYWIALMSQKFCWRKAIALGKAHEKANYKLFKKGKPDEESVLPDSISGAMDIFNNNVGASIGCQNKNISNVELVSIIKGEILKGKMKIISKNKSGEFLDCEGDVIDVKKHFGKWGIPKCLVSSDSIK
jgi:hypothetical protein